MDIEEKPSLEKILAKLGVRPSRRKQKRVIERTLELLETMAPDYVVHVREKDN